jgi:hypothetical protein
MFVPSTINFVLIFFYLILDDNNNDHVITAHRAPVKLILINLKENNYTTIKWISHNSNLYRNPQKALKTLTIDQ